MRKKGNYSRGENHKNAKLTADQVREIRKAYAAGGVTQVELAKQYGVGQTQIFYIVHEMTWKDVV